MRRSKRQAGFTILELMIVVFIVGIVVMAIAPSLMEVLAHGRAKAGMQEVLRLARRARWKALVTGTPHAVMLQGTGTGFGTATLYKGMGTRCDRVGWAQASALAVSLTEHFDFATLNPNAVNTTTPDTFIISLRPLVNNVAVASVLVCHQPNGESYFGVPVGGALTVQRQRVDIEARIGLALDGSVVGVPTEAEALRLRRIIFPPGNMPLVQARF